MSLKIDTRNLELQLTKHLVKLVANIRNRLDKDQIEKVTKLGTIRSATSASGSLSDSIKVKGQGLTFVIEMLEYYSFLEKKHFGRPPVDVILNWMKHKGIASSEDIKKQTSIAYAISKSISEKGTRPKYINFVEEESEKMQKEFEKIINDNITREFSKVTELWSTK